MRGLVLAGALLTMLLALKILWLESTQTHVAKINTAPTFVVVSSDEIPVASPCVTDGVLDESCANGTF
jgi:hypothetical protein